MSGKGEKKYFKRNHAFPLDELIHDHALAQELLALGHKFTFQVDLFWLLLLSPFCSMRRGREEDLKKQCSFIIYVFTVHLQVLTIPYLALVE